MLHCVFFKWDVFFLQITILIRSHYGRNDLLKKLRFENELITDRKVQKNTISHILHQRFAVLCEGVHYLARLWDPPSWLVKALWLPFIGPLNDPAQDQHAFHCLFNDPSITFFILKYGATSLRDINIVICNMSTCSVYEESLLPSQIELCKVLGVDEL